MAWTAGSVPWLRPTTRRATLPYRHHGTPGSLLDIALNFGAPLEHVCGGNCACTTCHVIVKQGEGHLSAVEEEADSLEMVTGDVVVEIPQ